MASERERIERIGQKLGSMNLDHTSPFEDKVYDVLDLMYEILKERLPKEEN